MRSEDLSKDEKKSLADFLKRLNIMPNRQGRVIIEISPDATVGRIELVAAYK